jgi:hypothetical protein
MRPVARAIHLAIAALMVVGLVFQVFLAGLGVFESAASFDTHRNVGYALGLVPILLLIIGLIGGLGRRLAVLAAVEEVLIVLQSVLVLMRDTQPAVAALHPLNGFLILLIALIITRESWAARTPAEAPAA